MKTFSKRLQKLERSRAFRVAGEDKWGALARFRDEIIGRAEQLGAAYGSEIRAEIDALGPAGLWRETARRLLADYGFVEGANESFAETMARVLGIDTDHCESSSRKGKSRPPCWRSLGRQIPADNVDYRVATWSAVSQQRVRSGSIRTRRAQKDSAFLQNRSA
jgi:hypothetical protein